MKTKHMTTTRTMVKAAFMGIVLVCWLVAPRTYAFSMDGHLHGVDDLAGILDLAGTPVGKGGIGPVTHEQAKAINQWIDNPATRIGQTRNRMAGGDILSPSNHRAQRHNPVRTARVFSGDGSVSPQALNQARMHKLQDIASAKGVEGGRAFVDGHQVTPTMQKKAQGILRYTRRYKHLPPDARLPQWLDNPGPGISRSQNVAAPGKVMVKASNSGATSVGGAKSGMRTTAKLGGKTVVGPLVVVLLTVEAYGTETAYVNGEIDDSQRTVRHVASGTGMAGGLTGAKVGSCAGAAIGTMIFPGVGTAVGAFVGGLTGGVTGYIGTRSVAEHVGERWREGIVAEDEVMRINLHEMYPDPYADGAGEPR